ncbi:hypothetical protein [Floccifex sp.]|uniref:hypothetical protein n=1 Tax=Floccifex sp. TaxID=2815810 RepID=UPI002A7551AF|nr:hypothetical protein [Floccifex sp.]MDD7280515.1 hypothetical protein [Erysipelotrichaceae bacterium]MDY2958532.1 hypothetical protein [Floccifex sp.]
METEIILTFIFTAIMFPLNLKIAEKLKDNKYKFLIIGLIFVVEFILYYKYIWSSSWLTMLLILVGYIPAIVVYVKSEIK